MLIVDNDPAASARDWVEGITHPALHYRHEPRPGVVNARNHAVSVSRGRYLAFIDDDEIACYGWIDALLRHVEKDVTASFGVVVPRYLGPVDRGLEPLLDDLYTRDLRRPVDADISSKWINVGTGNSLFNKQVCFTSPEPFHADLNGTGGEDVWLARSLVERGVKLYWNSLAVVEEQVPADRATPAYVRSRKYRHGQQRIVMERGAGGVIGWLKVGLWMTAGAAQWAGYSARAAALQCAGSPHWQSASIRASGGLGKILWWRLWRETPYALGSS